MSYRVKFYFFLKLLSTFYFVTINRLVIFVAINLLLIFIIFSVIFLYVFQYCCASLSHCCCWLTLHTPHFCNSSCFSEETIIIHSFKTLWNSKFFSFSENVDFLMYLLWSSVSPTYDNEGRISNKVRVMDWEYVAEQK